MKEFGIDNEDEGVGDGGICAYSSACGCVDGSRTMIGGGWMGSIRGV